MIGGRSSALGQQRPFRPWAVRSSLPSTSDMTGHHPDGCEGPTADVCDSLSIAVEPSPIGLRSADFIRRDEA